MKHINFQVISLKKIFGGGGIIIYTILEMLFAKGIFSIYKIYIGVSACEEQ